MTLQGLVHRLRVLVAPAAYAREVEAEMRFHLELEAMQARAGGVGEDDAEWEARRRFGNVTSAREEVRRMSGIEGVDRVRQDIGYAVRGLRQSPGFTSAVVLTLGLGLGVNAAMFTFLDRVFVKPPAAVVNPSQVRRVYIDGMMRDERRAYDVFRYPQIKEIARTADSGIDVGIFSLYRDTASIAVGANIIPASQGQANTAYFRALGVRPMLGRFFEGIEDRVETSTPVAVITEVLWRRAF